MDLEQAIDEIALYGGVLIGVLLALIFWLNIKDVDK
jgi:hypothetical protein